MSIVAQTRVLGIHCWPAAPEHRQYLRFPHQHEFIIEAQVEVTDHDRQIELHDLREMVASFYRDREDDGGRSFHDFGDWSCERIALDVISQLRMLQVPGTITCRVYEEPGIGAVVTDLA